MHEDRFGPVDHVVVQFTDAGAVRDGFDRLVQLVDAGLIRVLDLEFVHSIDGVASTLPAGRVDVELGQFDGAASGLLVHGRVQQRQRERWARQADAAPPAPPPRTAPGRLG